MIVSETMPDGSERILTPEEARAWNKEFGLSEFDQDEIAAFELGEIDGDVELLDEQGNVVRSVPSLDTPRRDQAIREAKGEAVPPVTKGQVQ